MIEIEQQAQYDDDSNNKQTNIDIDQVKNLLVNADEKWICRARILKMYFAEPEVL